MHSWRACSVVVFLTVGIPLAVAGEPPGADAGVGCAMGDLVRPRRVPQHDDNAGGSSPKGQGVSGTSVVKCVITVDGKVDACQVIQSVDQKTDAVVLSWLSRQRYTPVTCAGKPVAMDYVFNFHFQYQP
jgi:hypothetical protein